MTINLSKSTVSLGTIAKSGAGLTWDDSSPMTWDEASGTWDLPNLVTAGISKSSITKSAVTKS